MYIISISLPDHWCPIKYYHLVCFGTTYRNCVDIYKQGHVINREQMICGIEAKLVDGQNKA